MTSTSFYLSPELKARAINLAFLANGKYEIFVNQSNLKVIEREPSRCKSLLLLLLLSTPFSHPPPFYKVKLHFGGIGLYSSMKDYLTLLRHLLQIKCKLSHSLPYFHFYPTLFLAGKTPPNSIVSAKTFQEIFTPTLPSSALTSLGFYVSFFGVPAGNQWGTALALRTEDWPERRKKGSAYCTFNLLGCIFLCLCTLRRFP